MSTSAHGAEGRALPRSPSDLLLQPRACEVASPRRAQSRHLYWASRRSCSGRQGTALATGKPLQRQQQCTSIAGPTGWLKRLRSLGTVDGGRGCCWAPVPQPVAWFFFGACKASQARGANTGLAFAFFSPTRISKHSPCQGMCLAHTAAGQQLRVLPKLSVAHSGMGRWQTPPQPAFNLLKSESTALEQFCGREAGKGQDTEQHPGNNLAVCLFVTSPTEKRIFSTSP